MSRWDRERGVRSGRIVPEVLEPAGGDRVFVLGRDGESPDDLARLEPGDYTEVSQLVNLDGFDLVSANLESLCPEIEEYQPEPALVMDGDLFHFRFDEDFEGGINRVRNAFGLSLGAADVLVNNETYSPLGTRCREIPAAGGGYLSGENVPPWMPSPLTEYTFQVWIDFTGGPVSLGVNPWIFVSEDDPVPTNGIAFGLFGGMGGPPPFWYPQVTHRNGGGVVNAALPTFTMTPGWTLLSFVYDTAAFPPAEDLKLYVNDDPAYHVTLAGVGMDPAPPAPGAPITVADPDLIGRFDQMRLVPRAKSAAEIADDYQRCTILPPKVHYRWVMEILVNDSIFARRILVEDEHRNWTDFSAPVRRLEGEHEVKFRLKYEEV